MSKLLLASTSTVHGGTYLSYLSTVVQEHFSGCKNIVFIPFARPGGISFDEYTAHVQKALHPWGFTVRGWHTFHSPEEACHEADGFFTGGGNSFVLLRELISTGSLPLLQEAVQKGKPYMGSSAGTNIAGLTIGTTNDMPIVHPAHLNALACIPCNINPHYQDPAPGSTHMGETREQRIAEFHVFNQQPVLGLREGSWLKVNESQIELCGPHTLRLFRHDKTPEEVPPGLLSLV